MSDDEVALEIKKERLTELESLAKSFGRSITDAFAGGVVHGKNFSDILKTVQQQLSEFALKAALKPTENGLSTAFSSWAGSFGLKSDGSTKTSDGVGSFLGPNGLGAPISWLTSLLKFADGGVVNAPTWFPHAQGLGLAGEAGPEAIMPLARGPDGKLGVRGGPRATPTAVTVNISTPDADSFRRSEAQISAALARAVARGQRAM